MFLEKLEKLSVTIFTNNVFINLEILPSATIIEETMLSVRDLLRKYIVLLGHHHLLGKIVKKTHSI